jgi:predicted Zn-dependent protease with MMP-like domain
MEQLQGVLEQVHIVVLEAVAVVKDELQQMAEVVVMIQDQDQQELVLLAELVVEDLCG